jgi:hypothetical protein
MPSTTDSTITSATDPARSPAPPPVSTRERLAASAQIVARLATTSGHIVREKLTHPKAHDLSDVPVSAEDVTPAWLTAALCREHPGAEVVSVEFPASSSGTSTRHALRLTYNAVGVAAGLPTQLYTKTTTTLTQRLILGLAGVIGGEIDFFNRVRPLLEIETPRGYYAAIDPRSWRSISLIEDIAATKGARFLHSDSRIDRGRRRRPGTASRDDVAPPGGGAARLVDAHTARPADQHQVLDQHA